METKYKKVEQVIAERNTLNKHYKREGYKGVYKDNRPSRATSSFNSRFRIKHNEKLIDIYLGSYKSAEEAHIARCKFIDSLK